MSRVTTDFPFDLDIPKNARVGQEFTITGRARLTMIREDSVDYSRFDYVSGGSSYAIRVFDVKLVQGDSA